MAKEENTVGNGLLCVEAVSRRYVSVERVQSSRHRRNLHSRSLLSGETLEQDAGVLVDAKVVHSGLVGRGGLSPALGSTELAESRDSVTAEGLHYGDR
jgi:hypothetical protein